MGAKLNPGGQCLRFMLIGWNVFVVLVGVAALGVGIWQVVERENNENLLGEEYSSGPILSIVGGLIAMGVALLGIFGAIGLWRPVLVIYALIVTVFVAIELISGILGFVYRDTVEDTVSDKVQDAINDYTNKTDAEDLIDDVQKEFDCCGWNNYKDWINTYYYNETNNTVPDSCSCGDDDGSGSGSGDNDGDCITVNSQRIYGDGCRDSVVDFLRTYQLIVGAVGITFAVIQIFVIVIAMGLCICVHRSRGEYTTV